ncbi:OPT superfamily oligopeptide transporter [Acephala macrosclerotiorum]|nr:OPT superfamily oligopeptide transporter [Acephala macrosclerotiorum]
MKPETSVENLVRYDTWDAERNREPEVIANMETIALKALHVDDDPTLNLWTFRMFFLGIIGFGLSGFGSALATIFLFKPQSVSVSVIFLTVISYVIGNTMSLVIPSKGVAGRWFNPRSFNSKEHLAIVIMSSSASGAAYATEVLATQKLYYNIISNAVVAILLLLSSQLLGYGPAGVLRKSLVYPTKMVWPSILPLSSLIETLHRDKSEMRKKFNFFWIILSVVAVWELFPQNSFIGFVICTALYIGLYYGNVWQAMNFPFLSQSLFSPSSNSTLFDINNQSAILDANNELNITALETAGIPFFATTNAAYLLTTNLGITATSFTSFSGTERQNYRPSLKFWQKSPANRGMEKLDEDASDLDPHYKMMLAYNEVPAMWYIGILAVSMAVALFCIYNLNSTVPWWGLLLACLLSFLSTLFFGALAGLIGFNVPITSVVQLIGGYLHPGKPVANMYFVLFGANAQAQALFLVENLKLGQYGKLSPKRTFTVQIMGTVFGAIGTNIWSGQVIQSFNSNAIAFSALSKYMFSIGSTYQWILALPVGFAVPLPFYFAHRYWPKAGFDYFITPVICWYLGYLSVGINSSIMIYFLVGFFVQFFVRKRYPERFLKYNYILAAAISGGTELLVFVTTFTVQGASGVAIPFPLYWGNNFQKGNFDFCATNPALGG